MNKFSLKGKMNLHLKFETLYIKFQKYFIKFAFYKKLVLKLKKYYILFYIQTMWPISLDIVHVVLENWQTFQKKRLNVIKRGKSLKFQIAGLTYQIKIHIYDNYVFSELNFFYFRKGTYQIFILYTASVA